MSQLASMYVQSRAQMAFGLTRRCASCGKFSLKADVVDGNGQKLSGPQISAMSTPTIASAVRGAFGGRPITEADIAAVRTVCRKCGHRWAFFSVGVETQAPPPRPIDERQPVVPRRKDPEPVPVETRLELCETQREAEPIGDETRVIDNTRSSIATSRKLVARKSWRQMIEISREDETTLKAGGGVMLGIARLGAQAEREVSRRYGVETETTHEFSEEIEVVVPGGTRLELTLHWKRIWQVGVARATDGTEIPYRLVTGVTFDQTQLDGAGD